jgi:phytol kinase
MPLAARRHRSLGEIWFVCGVCLSFLLASDPVAYCIAILVVTLADAAAALVGRRFGRLLRMPLAARKSAAGSAAFFVVAFAVAFLALYAAADVPLMRAIGSAALVALLTTAIEAVLARGLDNLFVPLGALAALRAVS